ncbi:MAG: IS110 family transposase [Planctomycetota bacterium]
MIEGIREVCFVGVDVHQESLSVAVLGGSAERPEPARKIPNDPARIRRHFERLKERGELCVAYEAGCTGFVLWRQLTSLGIECMVAAPSRIPVLPGDRRKTDRLDAERLAIFLRGGQLVAVAPPTPELEALRSLTRTRDSARKDVVAAKHHVSKLLLHRGVIWRGRHRMWSKDHRAWLRALQLETPDDQELLRFKLTRLATREAELLDLDERIARRAERDDIEALVRNLKAFRGVQTLIAVNLVAELGDPSRFANHGAVAAYVGLVPSERSSGGSIRRGGITGAGSAHLRRLLVESVQQYRSQYAESKSMRERRMAARADVRLLAREVERRLTRRYRRLTVTKHTNVAKAAIARELVGHLWQAMRMTHATN